MDNNIHTPHHVKNHLFSEQYNYDGNFNVPLSVLLVQYNAGDLQFQEMGRTVAGWKESCRADHINWFDVTGLNDTDFIHSLVRELGFFPVDAKSILTPCHAAKIDFYDDRLIIVIRPSFF